MAEATKIQKIVVDRNLCIGAASCVVMAAGVFELDAENKAVIKQKGVKNSGPAGREELENAAIDDTALVQAAQSCPTKAIFLYPVRTPPTPVGGRDGDSLWECNAPIDQSRSACAYGVYDEAGQQIYP